MKTRQIVNCWLDRELDGLEVQLHRHSRHAFPNHEHEHYTFGLMEDGGSYCQGPERETSLVRAGEVALINPGEVHSGVPPEGVAPTFRMFTVSLECMGRAAREAGLDGLPEFPRMVVPDHELWTGLSQLGQLIATGGEVLAKETVLVGVLTRLVRQHGVRPVPLEQLRPFTLGHGRLPQPVRLAGEYLRSHLSGNVSLEELAAVSGVSRFHLLRLFKRCTGLSPHTFHVQRRLERSRELLRRGCPIAEAALETGFADQSHFTTTFRNYVGLTPGQYLAG